MKAKALSFLFTLSALLLVSCQNESNEEESVDKVGTQQESAKTGSGISFAEAKNYFVKNTASAPANPKIETSLQFEEIFGMATTMSPEGKPTVIDFDKQFVIAVILPETSNETTLSPVSLQKNAQGQLVFTYRKSTGPAQTFTVKPALAVVVDKEIPGDVVLKEIE